MKIENWVLFLMKKLIKSGVCGIREQYISTLFTEERVNNCGWNGKKKKNWGKSDVAVISAIQTSTKLYGHVWAFEM